MGMTSSHNYPQIALLFKALSDETRLKIIDLLSNGELCACDILRHLNITQPTLSYHMKTLSECGIVNARRQGAWIHYTLNTETMQQIADYSTRSKIQQEDIACQKCCDQPEEI